MDIGATELRKLARIVTGCVIVSIGILILRHAHLVTGGTAGLALSIAYIAGVSFSTAFMLVNIPFYLLSIMRMGWGFTVSTLFAVCTVSILTGIDSVMPDIMIPEWIGAILGGSVIGFGLSLLFWNRASLGGVNVLVLYLQKRFDWDPGKFTFVVDTLIVLSGIYAIGISKGMYSIVSVIIISSIISYFKKKIAQENA